MLPDDLDSGITPLPPSMLPAPQPYLSTPPPQQSAHKVDWMRLIGPLATIALAATGHPNAAIGAGHGSMLAEEQRRRDEAQQAEIAAQQQAAQIRMQQIAAAEEAKRQAGIQSLITQTAAGVKGAKTKDDYDRIVGAAEAMGGQFYGLRPNAIRAIVPYRAPDAGANAYAALDAFMKNPANKEAITSGAAFQNGTIAIDTDGDGKPDKPVPLLEAVKLSNYPLYLDPATNRPITTPKGVDVSKLDPKTGIVLQGLKTQFQTDKGRPPTDQELGDLLLKADKQVKQAEHIPTAGSGVGAGAGGSSDVASIADAIQQGLQPPDTKGLYRLTGPLRAELARRGYDLMSAQKDWQATQRWIATANGQTQTRMRQAIDNAAHSLDVIQDLAEQWKGGKFPILNRGRLAAAKQGAMGPDAQKIATLLEAQISDVTSELANVYMGGNSPTDHAMDLARKNLSGDWSEGQLLSALDLARKNLQIRQNSMTNTQPVSPGQAAPEPSAVEEWVRDPKTGKLVKRGG